MPVLDSALGSRPSRRLPRRAVTFVAVGAAAVLLAACGSNTGPTDTTPEPREATVPIAATSTTLLDPGSGDLAPIRFALAPGAEQDARLHTEMALFQQMSDQPRQDFSQPALTTSLHARVGDTTNDGTDVDLDVESVTAPDSAQSSALADATGSRAGLTVAPDGAVSTLRMRPSAESADATRGTLEQLFYQAVYRTIAFPAEPVGVGAVWEIHQQVPGGLTLDQVTTVTLTGRDGDVVTVDVTVRQTPTTATWTLPGGEQELTVDRYEMTGGGSLTIDTTRPLPTAGEVRVEGQQEYSDPAGTTRLAQELTNVVRWE